jgi:cell division protein FtsL
MEGVKKVSLKPKTQCYLSLFVLVCLVFLKIYTKYLYTKKIQQIDKLENELMVQTKHYHELEIDFKKLTNPTIILQHAKTQLPEYNYLDLKKIYEI